MSGIGAIDVCISTSVMNAFDIRLNPQFKIDIHNVAVSNKTGVVSYESDCNGCNGGITYDQTRKKMSFPSVKLFPYLQVKHIVYLIEIII